jgi:hypothetical protein
VRAGEIRDAGKRRAGALDLDAVVDTSTWDVIAARGCRTGGPPRDDTFQPGVLSGTSGTILEHATATEGTTTRLHIGNLATDCG